CARTRSPIAASAAPPRTRPAAASPERPRRLRGGRARPARAHGPGSRARPLLQPLGLARSCLLRRLALDRPVAANRLRQARKLERDLEAPLVELVDQPRERPLVALDQRTLELSIL